MNKTASNKPINPIVKDLCSIVQNWNEAPDYERHHDVALVCDGKMFYGCALDVGPDRNSFLGQIRKRMFEQASFLNETYHKRVKSIVNTLLPSGNPEVTSYEMLTLLFDLTKAWEKMSVLATSHRTARNEMREDTTYPPMWDSQPFDTIEAIAEKMRNLLSKAHLDPEE